ncbi:hypothetical protein [Oceanirhabdus sp. W0125-5]|uniref:hypothetical protein n=1 Tax=Oceanirhabdus sp. W0125-5 TaxID=2999116 RepID=UPI0022F2DB63|nr:hypothetical protein [Oceanirhabdus sp. W0125-5]WBW98303.1 hypothetical protein OW730_05905 [Oceanirhabdus sp. W0125-5]
MGKKHRNLPAKQNGKNKIVPMNYRMKRIDAKNILSITPNELFKTWKDNKDKMEFYVNKLKNEVLYLQKQLATADKKMTFEIMTEIEHKKEEMSRCEQSFREWIGGIENGINSVVHRVFEKILKGASKNDISNVVIEFSNTFSQAKYGNEKLENILVYFVNEYKANLIREAESRKRAMEVGRYNSPPSDIYYPTEIYDNYSENLPSAKYENAYITNKQEAYPQEYYDNQLREITRYNQENNLDKVYDNNKQNMRFFSISIFYGSYGNQKNKYRKIRNKPFGNMLLGAFDAMSNFLYGNIQNTLDELYEDLNDK